MLISKKVNHVDFISASKIDRRHSVRQNERLLVETRNERLGVLETAFQLKQDE